MSAVVVVESPAKSKTLERYLGKDFKVLASYGHVRDLRAKSGAVDPEKDFSMQYEPIEKNSKHVDAIAKALKKADTLYLATDPDREGEAISWHLHELLKDKGALKDKKVHRVVFRMRSSIRVNLPITLLMPSRRDVLWIIWSVLTCRRFCGKKCSPAYLQAACNRPHYV